MAAPRSQAEIDAVVKGADAPSARVHPETGDHTDIKMPPGPNDVSLEAFEAAYLAAMTIQPARLRETARGAAAAAARPANAAADSIEKRLLGTGNHPPGFTPTASVPVLSEAGRWRLADAGSRSMTLADKLTNTFTLAGRRAYMRATGFTFLSVAALIAAACLVLAEKGCAVPGAARLYGVGLGPGGEPVVQPMGRWNMKVAAALFVASNALFAVMDFRLSRDTTYMRRDLVRLRWMRSIASLALAVPTGIVATGVASLHTLVATLVAVAAILAACWVKDALPNRYIDNAMLATAAAAAAAGCVLGVGGLLALSRAHGLTENDLAPAVVAFVWLQLLAGTTVALNTSMSPVESERASRHCVALTLYTGLDIVMSQAFIWSLYARYT